MHPSGVSCRPMNPMDPSRASFRPMNPMTPSDTAYLSGEDEALIEIFPELGTFRDIVYLLKATMVPSGDALPDVKAWLPADAKLQWSWKEKAAEQEGVFTQSKKEYVQPDSNWTPARLQLDPSQTPTVPQTDSNCTPDRLQLYPRQTPTGRQPGSNWTPAFLSGQRSQTPTDLVSEGRALASMLRQAL